MSVKESRDFDKFTFTFVQITTREINALHGRKKDR